MTAEDKAKKDFLEEKGKIKKEKEKFIDILRDLEVDENRLRAADPLIENAAFMSVALKNLQNEIAENGMITQYQNGPDQWGTKQSDEVKTYNTMIYRYNAIMKQLLSLIPDDEKIDDDINIIEQFANSRPD
jgi:hypothetical protein